MMPRRRERFSCAAASQSSRVKRPAPSPSWDWGSRVSQHTRVDGGVQLPARTHVIDRLLTLVSLGGNDANAALRIAARALPAALARHDEGGSLCQHLARNTSRRSDHCALEKLAATVVCGRYDKTDDDAWRKTDARRSPRRTRRLAPTAQAMATRAATARRSRSSSSASARRLRLLYGASQRGCVRRPSTRPRYLCAPTSPCRSPRGRALLRESRRHAARRSRLVEHVLGALCAVLGMGQDRMPELVDVNPAREDAKVALTDAACRIRLHHEVEGSA